MKQIFILLIFFCSLISCIHDRNTFRCVEYVRNYDGDTVTFNIPSVHPLFGEQISIRILNVDTAEIQTKNECEKIKAIQAKQVVERLLKQAQRIDLHNIQRGKYFRIVADIKADGVSIGEFLIKNNLAYYYSGGKKQQRDWCSK